MKTVQTIVFIVFVLVIVLVGLQFLSLPYAAPDPQEIKDLQVRIDNLKQRLESLQNRINNLDQGLRNRINNLDQRLEKRINGVDRRVQNIEKRPPSGFPKIRPVNIKGRPTAGKADATAIMQEDINVIWENIFEIRRTLDEITGK